MVACSNLESIVFVYFCHVYDPADVNMKIAKPEFRPVPIFKFFDYEDSLEIFPLTSIYSKSENLVAVDDPVVRDPMLYFIFTYPSSISVFARLDMTQNYTIASFSNKSMTGFSFEVLCNPFEGYKFDQEFQYASERYLLRVLVEGKTS